ncbi:hypothetical protein EX30DRAFT_300966 [Ascodesmis nigricans]|uniref:Tyrosine specific protein phosphatases domain-containing protein n=1 Tax=Ascodesmis nigricans TaxID=341454 RepID=A0A4S2N7Q0_9PEZI|nr:hypothetical protein EX30DRAFT_300966 [Ascodesmis nigricans]
MDGLAPTTRATLLNEGCEPFQYHNDIDFDCLGADREPTYVPTIRLGNWYKIPRFFSWIIPHVLAGMSTPKSTSDVTALRRMGITLVITLTAEEPLPNSFFALVKGGGIRNEFFPTANYFPPTALQMDRILSAILNEAENGGATLVHCGGGKGRAGSVLACYLALFGTSPTPPLRQPPKMTSHAAIDLVRSLRPGSIETAHQETFIERYVSQAWKRYGSNTPLIGSEDTELDIPSTSPPLLINGDITRPDVILLIGLQGSGKSHFTSLIRLRNTNTITASPDSTILANPSLGSAAATKSCESIISNFRKSPSTNRVLILDRTNPTSDDRKHFLSLFTTTNPKCIAIFFDTPTEICINRVELRGEHPTLPPWRASTAIKSTAKLLQPPTLSEGFTGIATIRTQSAAVELANILFSLSGLPLFKFPRTKHLLNLGSATRDDLVISEDDQSRIFNSGIYGVITEKVDGANMGFSLDSNGEILVQNRSHYIPISSAIAATAEQMQFAKLPNWVDVNREKLMRVLRPHGERFPERWMLFGEWMYAVHSIRYNALPSLFVAFDLYDRLEHRFLPFMDMRERVHAAGLEVVPVVYNGEVKEEVLRELVNGDSGYVGEREGVVVRFGKRGEGERGKVVREGFMRDEEGEEVRHWRKREVRRNVVRMEGGEE